MPFLRVGKSPSTGHDLRGERALRKLSARKLARRVWEEAVFLR
jgi:hypothetical protein